MRTFFDMGMRRAPWDLALGQLPDMETPAEREEREEEEDEPGFWDTFGTGLEAFGNIAEGYFGTETAEEKRKAEQARIEAERLRLETERLRAAGLRPTTQEAAGIPTGILVAGGVGLVGAILAAVLLTRG